MTAGARVAEPLPGAQVDAAWLAQRLPGSTAKALRRGLTH